MKGTTITPITPVLATPESIKIEHEHLHHRLDAAIASGGKTGTCAEEVAAILEPHFEKEEAYAMPPLGLLVGLAGDGSLDDAQSLEAIKMAERLETEYSEMLEEHVKITEALAKLEAAAKEEGKSDHADFAEALAMHAKNEEQVLYPATILIGKYLRLLRNSDRSQ